MALDLLTFVVSLILCGCLIWMFVFSLFMDCLLAVVGFDCLVFALDVASWWLLVTMGWGWLLMYVSLRLGFVLIWFLLCFGIGWCLCLFIFIVGWLLPVGLSLVWQ